MAAAQAMTNRHIVSLTLHHLSSMMYRDRRQRGPDQPVEFLEFRPTLVPSIMVNKLWADEGTFILWARYPDLAALETMDGEKRQWYASKIERVSAFGLLDEINQDFTYLEGLQWPRLKSLELEVDWKRHGHRFESMLHSELEHLGISGPQTGGSKYFAEEVLAILFSRCQNLRSLRIGTDTIHPDDPVHVSALFSHLASRHSLNSLHIKSANFLNKDALFTRLSQRSGFEALEIDLDPGLQLLPLLSGPFPLKTPFLSLKRLQIMCYPEVALALPVHLHLIQELQLDLARIPDAPFNEADLDILQDLFTQLSHCPQLQLLKVGIAQLGVNFPSFSKFPRLTGNALVALAESCPKLDDISIFAADPSAIDGSKISSDHFDKFCKGLPHLRSLSLKLHNTKGSELETTALQILGAHCPELEILRLKMTYQLATLPVPSLMPDLLLDGELTPSATTPGEAPYKELDALDLSHNLDHTAPTPDIHPLFPKLTHLAIARPETHLSLAAENFFFSTVSNESPPSIAPSLIVSPELEEALVRSWAHPLLTHFPRLEILEAWGDWSGNDNESLNYFLPMEEVLASTWEFLSGVEQDLWEDGDEGWEQESYAFEGSQDSAIGGFDGANDWEKANLMNEFEARIGALDFQS